MKKTTLTPEEKLTRKRQVQADYLKRSDYNRKHMYQFLLAFHRENEADLIEWLAGIDNRNGYIKDLIRRDMEAYRKLAKSEETTR